MRTFYLILLFVSSTISVAEAAPATYGSAKIYILDPQSQLAEPPSAGYIRKYADIVITTDSYTRTLFDSLHWERAKHNPAIAKRAKPLIMVIDFYDRVQPDPPEAPRFTTLYCTRDLAYTEDGDYIDIAPLTAKLLQFPLRH